MKTAACGKVILFGEHAVVYGVPAIAVGIDRGASAEVSPVLEGAPTELFVPAWDVHETGDPVTDEEPSLGRAFRALVQVTRARGALITPVRVTAHADLPPGGGLGCSAALGVAIARALDPTAPTVEIISRVHEWESVFHGNPSGIDATVAARGGSVYFEKDRPLEAIPLRHPLILAIGQTGIGSSTRAMVEMVARHKERTPEKVERTFEGIRSLVRNARLALEAGDHIGLGKLLDLNHMLLAGLFLSTAEIETMVGSARENGALGAKLTGAGGGGSVVALCTSETVTRVIEAWREAGFQSFIAGVSATQTNAADRFSAEARP